MHGRLKIKTTAEQQEAKKNEQAKKIKYFKSGMTKIFEKRKKKEYDAETLSLTKDILLQNPDINTLWNLRKEVLLDLKPKKTFGEHQDLQEGELELTQNCLKTNPKSYGAWHHRFWCLSCFSESPNWSKELKLCNLFLSIDERNFHCWDYRRIVCKQSSVRAEDELDFTINLIEKNFSNYSAWHYRSTLLPMVYPGPGYISVDENMLLKEYEMVQNAAFTDPNDQSVWFYHRWLLGRGNKAIDLIKLAVLRETQTVIIVFSNPVQVNEKNRVLLMINEREVELLLWHSACADLVQSTVWYCNIPNHYILTQDPTQISVKFTNSLISSKLVCNIDSKVSYCQKANPLTFCYDISAATKDVLQKELESCQQLHDLEPNNKWVIFTTVMLMKAIDSKKYHLEILKLLEKLIYIDNMRKHYYLDLRSKFIIEDVIEETLNNAIFISITNQNLTCLYHFDYFVLTQKIDLSFNNLKSVKFVQYLLCVEELILDNNELEDCEDIKNLSFLKILSMCNNFISSKSDFSSLTTCPQLKYFYIKGNKVIEDSNCILELKNKLNDVKLDIE